MPVLRALAARSTPATAPQIHRAAGGGTEAGVRRAIDRLAKQGVILRDEIGDRSVYSLNYEHVLNDAVRALLRAPDELPRRLRKQIGGWSVEPLSAALYGSAARRDGDAESDIDVLLVRASNLTPKRRQLWNEQAHLLREQVRRWTGNHCQITDRSRSKIKQLAAAGEPIVDAWLSESIHLGGKLLDQLLDEQ